MRQLLQLYASDSADLISRYYWDRIKEQRALQAGEYKLGSITVRAQLLRDHLRVEVSTDDHNNNVWSRISSESFSPFKPLTYAPPREPIYQIDDCALIRDSMKFPLKKGSERAPPEAT